MQTQLNTTNTKVTGIADTMVCWRNTAGPAAQFTCVSTCTDV